MKLQTLTIHNIASFEDASINFAQPPLSDSDVFLITGNTGAGKSTILDAICLALYANTPRLNSTNMQGETQDGDRSVKIDDPRQLMRRNTGEAYVSLSFIGNNGVHYQATWGVARARKNVTGNIQSKSWELKNLDRNITYTKDNEIRAEIHSAIGLDFNQFRRITMLPQGEFTRFLNSPDNDKAEILEKITGVDAYSRIGRKIYETTVQKRQQWEDAQRQVSGVQTLSDEELDQKNEALRQINDQCDALKKEQDKTIEARNKLEELEDAKLQKSAEEDKLHKMSGEFQTLLAGQLYSKGELRALEDAKHTVDKYIEENEPKKSVYANAQTIVGHLNTITAGRQNIADYEARKIKGEKSLNEAIIPAQQQADAVAKTANDNLAQKESELKSQEDELKKMDLPVLRNLRDKAKDLLANILSAEEKIDTLNKAKSDIQNRRTLNDRLKATIDDNTKAANDLEAKIHDAEIKRNVRKEDLDKQRDTVDKFAKTLRAKLQIGDICPVCQQKIVSELPKEADLSAIVDGLQKLYNEAEKECADLLNAKNKLDAQIKSDTDVYNREAKAIANDTSVADAERKALSLCNACGVTGLNLPALNDLQSSTNDRLTELNAKIHSGEAQEKIVETLRQEIATQRKQKETADEALRAASKAVDDYRNGISTILQLIESKHNDVTNAQRQVETLLTGTVWNNDWYNDPQSFITTLTDAANTYNSALTKQTTLDNNIKTKRKEIDDVAKALNAILQTMPVWQTITAPAATPVANLLEHTNTLAQKLTALLTKLSAARDIINRNTAWLDSFLVDNNLSLNRLEESLLALNNHISALNQQIGAIRKELSDDAANKARLGQLMQEVEAKLAIYEKWSRLDQLIGDATGNKFRKIAQSYVLANLVYSANGYMSTLTDRYTLKVIPGTFVILVEDAYQGYASRAASTISGGESFLVSLSLALALSDIGDNLSVDTIFIDEGFGTLSGDSLQMAISTLRSLHTKAGRNVGIISHVEELQANIPVQIQVIQNTKTACSTINIATSFTPNPR